MTPTNSYKTLALTLEAIALRARAAMMPAASAKSLESIAADLEAQASESRWHA